ncbi:L-gulonolactone oxidase, partial [Chelonia mydas]
IARGRGGQALNSPRCGDGWLEAQQRDEGSSANVRPGGRLHLGSEKTKEALLELKAVLENNPKVVAHYPVEVRFARGDDVLLSPCFQRDSCYMNIIMYRPYGKDVPRLDYWLAYESIMKKAGGRPHWAKAHTCTRKDFEKMYPGFQKFCTIREELDPTGMFLNAYLEKVFY